METTKKRNKTAMGFVLFMLISVCLALFLAKTSFDKSTQIETTTSPKVIDSIITQKVDWRLTSYDNRFIYTNSVVIDEKGHVIGKLIIQTNESEIDSFYNQNPAWFKTKTYENLKTGKLEILQKE